MKKIIIIILFFVIGFSSALYLTGGWDNFKLRLTRFWGFFTISNNPLFFDYDKDFKGLKGESRVSRGELLSGGPGKDGIPALDSPKFAGVGETSFSDEELVVGVYLNGEARAYPYGILNWHEIVNDKIGDTPISVTLCPLCDTNPVFIRRVDGVETTFGVSGKLFQSCLVMYDRATDSLWAQPWGVGVFGKHTNDVLELVPAAKTTLGNWKKKYPDTKVLSSDTGYSRDYFRYPYGTYYTDRALIFPARNQDKLEFAPKEIISYLWRNNEKTPLNTFSGHSLFVVHKDLKKEKEKELDFGEQKITVRWDEELETVRFWDTEGKELPASTAFAFVYPAFFN